MPRQYDNNGEVVVFHSPRRVFTFLSSEKTIGVWHPDFPESRTSHLSIHFPEAPADTNELSYQFGTEYRSDVLQFLDAYDISARSDNETVVHFSRRVSVIPQTGFKKLLAFLHDPTLFGNPVKNYPTVWATAISDAISSQCVCAECTEGGDEHLDGSDLPVIPEPLSDPARWDVMRRWIDCSACKTCGIKLPRLPARDRWRFRAGLLESIMVSSGKVRFAILKSRDPFNEYLKSLSEYFGHPKLQPDKMSNLINQDLNQYTLKGTVRDFVLRDLEAIRKSRQQYTHDQILLDHRELFVTTNAYLRVLPIEEVVIEKYRPWLDFCSAVESLLNRTCIECGKTYCRNCSN